MYLISLLGLVSRYLLLSLLVFIARLSYQYDLPSRLPEPAKQQLDALVEQIRAVQQVRVTLELLNSNQVNLEQFIPNIYVIGAGLVITTIILSILKKTVIKETLLIVRDLGIQTCSHTLGGGQSKKFHDISRIRDFIINDYVAFYFVRQYCAFLVENESQMVIPFKECDKLRQVDLEYIYCNVKQIISIN